MGNSIEVFFNVSYHEKYSPLTTTICTLEDTESVGSTFELIDAGEKDLDMAFNGIMKKYLLCLVQA